MNNEKSLKLIMSAALAAAKPKDKFKKVPTRPEGKLIVIGAGKAAASMAREFENNYEGPIEGLVITRYGHSTETRFVKVIEAAHPEPDANGLLASKRIFNIATNSSEKDHVVFLISGGASSLLTLPLSGISFEEKQRINKELLISGAPIDEMNIVRRSLSQLKGGRLAKAIFPAQLTTYMISDIPGDDPAYIGSGPTIQANGSNHDSITILEKYKIEISDKIKKIVDSILSSKKPIFYGGGGIINSGTEASRLLNKIVDLLNAPVTLTLMGLGAIAHDNKNFLGMLGMHGTYEANLAMHNCDLLINVGARFDDRVTGRLDAFSPNSKKIHIDICLLYTSPSPRDS